ncbi:MAG TPA: hypothetical protein VII94_04465, partial [Candidatus Saccharimonadales bacterium]
MSNYPNQIDDDSSLPAVNDNITQEGGAAINALRDATINIETALGTDIAGTCTSLATRLGVFINQDGYPNSSILTSLGLITLPITNNQIIANAMIPESKLDLDYKTQDLFNYISDLSKDINLALGWISISGVKLEPHLAGFIYRHDLADIDVAEVSSQFLNNVFRVVRDNANSYTLINGMNNELLAHQWADGSPLTALPIKNIITNNGSIYPSNYAHLSSGLFLNSSLFVTIPQTIQDVQSAFDYFDSNGLSLIGSRVQNLYSNGISRSSESSVLGMDGYGPAVIPLTPCITYLLSSSTSTGNVTTSPVDNINYGDDIISFQPVNDSKFLFDEQFSQVRIGDIITVNYGTIQTQFLIKEKKYQSGQYVIRIAGINLQYSTTAIASISRPLFNNNKYGVLATAAANYLISTSPNNASIPISSLIVGNPRGAQVLGVGFNADAFSSSNYKLYLALYPDGNPNDGYTVLKPIDVTGNAGATPGAYTLDSIVAATNNAFRQPGYNYRFIAFQYEGQFGIMLADSFNNVSFSVMSGIINSGGTAYDPTASAAAFQNNVIGVTGSPPIDPLGFGINGSNIASPPYTSSYTSANAAYLFPTKVFLPRQKNTFYVNGTEQEKLLTEIDQTFDNYGDGYWAATVDGYQVFNGSRIEVTYFIPADDLDSVGLKAGKTIVVQPLNGNTGINTYGRFVISSLNFQSCADGYGAYITVYDGVHSGLTGTTSSPILPIGTPVALYFTTDSISFNLENATDTSQITPFKRYFEVYIDENSNTFTHERGRMFIGTGTGSPPSVTINNQIFYTDPNVSQINIVKISPKLRGYQAGTISKISLVINSYNSVTGSYDGYLCNYVSPNFNYSGPLTSGQVGTVTRFYDSSYIDYIDAVFSFNNIPSTIVSGALVDIQLFPTLSLDKEQMILSTCQFNDSTNIINYIEDQRQFGNVSEEILSTSALDYIAAPTRLINDNGIIRGFDVTNPINGTVTISGGVAIVNGNIIQIDSTTLTIPSVVEAVANNVGNLNTTINWFLCVNENSELELIANTDFLTNSSFYTSYVAAGANQRIFYVLNQNSLSNATYAVRGGYLSDLVLNHRDVTPIALITSIVTETVVGPPAVYGVTTLTVSDMRRYVTNGFGGLNTFTLGPDSTFRSFTSAVNWATQTTSMMSSTNGTNEILFSKFLINGPIIIPPTAQQVVLEFNSNVIFDGSNGGTIDINLNAAFALSSNVIFTNTIFNINVANAFTIQGPSVSLINNEFNWNYDPSILPDVGYSTSNLINSQNGLIYCNIFIDEGIDISNNSFIWQSSNSNATVVNRYPFISFEYITVSDFFGIDISYNTFNSMSNSNPIIDLRPAISFVNTLITSGNLLTAGSALYDVNIVGNICYQDQMIVITTATDGSGDIGDAITTKNVIIANNTCGLISFFNRYSTLNDTLDKNYGLSITRNTCKVIGSVDNTGTDIGSNARSIAPITGSFEISDNICSWILPTTNAPTSINNISIPNGVISTGIIRHNTLNANLFANLSNYGWSDANTAIYITNFGLETFNITAASGSTITTSAPHGYLAGQTVFIYGLNIENGVYTIILAPTSNTFTIAAFGLALQSSPVAQPSVYCTSQFFDIIIDGNSIQQGQDASSIYSDGIHNENYGRVVNNNISGFDGYALQLWGPGMTVTNNRMYRNGNTITAFIDGGSSIFPSNQHVITSNYFDSTTIDGATTTLSVNISPAASYTRNVNQTEFAAFSLGEYQWSFGAIALYSNYAGAPFQGGFLLNINPGDMNISWNIPVGSYSWSTSVRLSNVVPHGTHIKNATFGFSSNDHGGSDITGGTVLMTISSQVTSIL